MENEVELAPFNIPQSAYAPIRHLVELEPEDFDSIVSGLKSAKPSISSAALIRHIASAASRVPLPLVSSIIEEIVTLEYLKNQTEMSLEVFSAAVSRSALAAASEQFRFDSRDSEVLESRLTTILKSDHILDLKTKAISVFTDHDNVFLKAKIITDARPVFNDDGSEIEAFAVIHMLRIHFEHNDNNQNFFTALDVDDLRQLREVIERAERKAETLKAVFKVTDIPYIDVEPTHVDA